ncbi:MAG: Anaerobic c4-dicarboxylate membrane transporter [Idiomarinaceae bacterium HL-53]|nr:MAG: Anaerobic c4-dicarboxylate membrane transporter [Idiomarinaceae bacterium HL-53]CUS49206.1 hypothetical protein Ga0003345_2194 [Idiomarinaceae bacterium HL-53]
MSVGPVILLVAIPVTVIGLLAYWLISGIRKAEAKRVEAYNASVKNKNSENESRKNE